MLSRLTVRIIVAISSFVALGGISYAAPIPAPCAVGLNEIICTLVEGINYALTPSEKPDANFAGTVALCETRVNSSTSCDSQFDVSDIFTFALPSLISSCSDIAMGSTDSGDLCDTTPNNNTFTHAIKENVNENGTEITDYLSTKGQTGYFTIGATDETVHYQLISDVLEPSSVSLVLNATLLLWLVYQIRNFRAKTL